MKIINTGNVYNIYDDSLQTFDSLPTQSYVVRFAEMRGFYLEKHNGPEVNEKTYGVHLEKVNKVLGAYRVFDRHLGVILSGDKGIGKSLFAKLLAIKAADIGLPLIIVDTFYPGIASYLESIEQEALVLFDEFDKTFGGVRNRSGEADAQTGLLSLFDGLSTGKKLFVITCNELNSISEYLVNRPGRFHYHFRFEYPTDAEIREYMADKLLPAYHDQVESIVSFAQKVNVNFDCLRAIAFELNTGLTFKEAIKDLNILRLSSGGKFRTAIRLSNGQELEETQTIDMFGDFVVVNLRNSNGENVVDVSFNPQCAVFNPQLGCYLIRPEHISYDWVDGDARIIGGQSLREVIDSRAVEYLTIRRVDSDNYHYAL